MFLYWIKLINAKQNGNFETTTDLKITLQPTKPDKEPICNYANTLEMFQLVKQDMSKTGQ